MKRFILVFYFISFSVEAQEFLTKSGNVVFLSEAPLNEFTGESDKLNGLVDLDKNLVDFFIDLNTIETGIGLRDRHMRDNYLETEKFPYAEFTGKLSSKPTLKTGQRTAVSVPGKFKIHGIERDMVVGGHLTALSNGDLKLEANFEIQLSNHDIPIPKLVFYELAEEQKVTISAILKQSK